MPFLERADGVVASINNQVTLGRLQIPLAIGEIAVVKSVWWSFWPASGDGTATAATYWGALSFNFKLDDLPGAIGITEVGIDRLYWGHFFVANKLGTNVGFSQQQMSLALPLPEPGYPIGGDQGIVCFQDTGINPTAFRVTLWYTRENVGEARALSIATRTSISKVVGD